MEFEKLESKLEQLKSKKFVIINVAEEEKEQICERIKKYPLAKVVDLVDSHIAIYEEGNKNDEEILKENIMYSIQNRDYIRSISLYKQLLSIDPSKSYIYGKIGICYLKIQRYRRALKYFEIANKLDNSNDYSKTIELLENYIYSNEYIQRKERNLDFENDIEYYYGIEKINEVRKMVLVDKISLMDACKKLEIKEFYIPIISLIFAREFYCDADYKNGDRYYKMASNSKENETEFSKSLKENIKTNRLFYKNRENKEEK